MKKFFGVAWDFLKKAMCAYYTVLIVVYIIIQFAFFGFMLFAPDKWPTGNATGTESSIDSPYY